MEQDVEHNVRMLLAPYRGGGHDRDRERALAVLLDHPDEAHPRLLALLEEMGPGANPAPVIAALPLFGRAESVPALDRLLREGSEATAMSAAAALARHPLPAAGDALRAALRDDRAETAAAAADGLLERGDAAACPDLLAALEHPDREVRYRARQAADGLGC